MLDRQAVFKRQLDPAADFHTVLGVLGRTMSGAIKAQTQAALALARQFAKRTAIDLRAAIIDKRFDKRSSGPFDQDYMKALFEYGEAMARSGNAFRAEKSAAPAGRDIRPVKETDATHVDQR